LNIAPLGSSKVLADLGPVYDLEKVDNVVSTLGAVPAGTKRTDSSREAGRLAAAV
jgi:hypothetical protein